MTQEEDPKPPPEEDPTEVEPDELDDGEEEDDEAQEEREKEMGSVSTPEDSTAAPAQPAGEGTITGGGGAAGGVSGN